VAERTIRTEVGQRDSVLLTDGTRVLLGPGSRLSVASGYGQRQRQVELVGQAYFEVVHNADLPFTVQTGNAHIQDVGTAFTVRTGDDDAVVAVTEGTVLLRATAAADAGVFLQPGDRGVVRASARASAQKGAVSAQDTAWRHGRLIFRDAPLADVQLTLRRWYGIELRLADSAIARRHLTASFEGESVEQVLHVIGLALGAAVQRHADTALVRLTPTSTRQP
jgi:transmembrane sensor